MDSHGRMPALVRLGTRASALARWQTEHIAGLLLAAWPGLATAVEIIHTQGDRDLDTPLPLIGGKGVFTAELEEALRRGAIDLAVHSLKDLPIEASAPLLIGAVPARAPASDVLVSRYGYTLDTLPPGAVVGTSSIRRGAQLLHRYPRLILADLRGNVDTRVRKALDPDGPFDAIILAQAGLERLGRRDVITQVLPLEVMMPAPGQGALAVQCRDDDMVLALLAPIDDPVTRATVTAERTFLQGLGGGCAVPVAAYATMEGELLHVRGRVTALNGSQQVDVAVVGPVRTAEALGRDLAALAAAQGAGKLLVEGAQRQPDTWHHAAPVQ